MGFCIKCLTKPIVKYHMCESCEKEHDEWLGKLFIKPVSRQNISDDDGFYTIYESGGRQNGS